MEWFSSDNRSLMDSTASHEYPVPDVFLQQKQRPGPTALEQPSFATSDGNRSSISQATIRHDSVGCDCITSALGVVQQLDDDHFKLSSLSLDQVIQLQKWIQKSAGASLKCESCKDDSKVLTVVVIVCERLTEMFECIHRRIDQATQETLGGDPNLPRLVSMSDEQLYPSLGTKEGCDVRCNTALFSMEFQKMYSGEEQVHMIKVLLRLQMRNLQAHLVTLTTIYDSKANEARRHKISSLTARLSRAASAIDNSLQNLLEHQRNER
ncbi:hypothetical protein BDZ85DRAFT_45698 [Elsinoe ampelina]|uniref:Uncharacterized protein n=1 Tax=Elsinoe ampelina TaxID=302913 RepID=A0A6A6G0V2_9PEZI|nr:hypothetical protein BDZ85DRAFT_45698 [Elsinoe ampelina]